jgi:tRNA(Ile)-lysidine synthase
MRETHPSIFHNVREFCVKNDLVEKGDRILLAVSGGPDSTALLHIFYELKKSLDLDLGVAHVNHGIRGSDADLDQQFVEKLAAELGLPFYFHKVQVASLRRKRESPEESARRVRYQFLLDRLHSLKFDKLATGHTLEDNIETVLYRLATGTGPGGASGIQPRIGPVIHPLLELSRKRILKYLQDEGINYRIDGTNLDRSVPRNRIRHEILPVLEHINRRYREHFGTFAMVQRAENVLLDRLAQSGLDTVLEDHDGSAYVIRYSMFVELELAIRRRIVLHLYDLLTDSKFELRKGYMPFKVLDRIAAGDVEGNKTIYQNNLVTVKKEYDHLMFKKRVVDIRASGYLYHVHEIGSTQPIPEIGKLLNFSLWKNVRLFENGCFERDKIYLDYDRIELPIIVRSRKPGDRIRLKDVGRKKLKDLFIDQKINKSSRDRVPILECNDEIIGVFCSFYGLDNRVSEGFMITDRTENVLVGELKDWKR